jgi:hypothetical protein
VFLDYVSIETLLAIHVVSLLIERQPILDLATSSLFDFMRVAIFDLALALTL